MQTLTMMMMTIMMMSFLYSALAHQTLECYNDFRNIFTCVWDTHSLHIRPDTSCTLIVTVTKQQNKSVKNAQMLADPTRTHIRSATVDFNLKRGIITSFAQLEEEVRCENYSEPLAKIAPHDVSMTVVKLAPPQKVEVRGLNASWTINSTLHTPMFEVQFRTASQSWTDVKIGQTEATHLDLPEDDLYLQERYVIRVRVKLDLTFANWSDWSQEYSWTSEVGRTRPTPGVPVLLPPDWSVAGFTLTGFTLVLVSVCVLIFCDRRKSLKKNCSRYIPDPAMFFGDLNSRHGGNFTSWLGPFLAHESFIKVDTECVSPVEVLKPADAGDSRSSPRDRDSGGLQDRWDGTSKSSNFSNSTYFLSQTSKGAIDTLEPCSTDSSYGPAGGVSGPDPGHAHVTRESEEKELELKTLERLRQDTQSPDSGFAGGAEDSMEESDLPSPLALNLTRLLPQGLPAPHPIMHLGFKHTPGFSCAFPGLMELDLQSPCGMIEPSSGDYMPVKSVQN
ncbi:interleukin-2 receptor subunit beta isoform X2 [Pimephales promelas]|uniref:interleukin-2 receptor subunit beta isoform X2 n=1 Tax=Pimephales promelas TaxID=90988 RepID=UPI0019558949|nr:interleukin-2 receptor subunit beta isoform X2 [Pimephales promelas]KAG1934221.1 interleukin-9 receptor [Pimephales promelas]